MFIAAATGAKTTAPEPKPAAFSPLARPRLSGNKATVVAVVQP